MRPVVNIKNEIATSEGLSFSVCNPTFFFYPTQLKLLKKAKLYNRKKDELEAINILIIISTTAFIESILYESLKDIIISYKYEESDKILKNILKSTKNSMANATFKNYEQFATDVLGKSLGKFTSPDTWESIKTLFSIRNQFAHGREFLVDYIDGGNYQYTVEPSKNYKTIVEFLIKKKLIKKDIYSLKNLLTNSVTNYFIKTSKVFFDDITNNLSNEFGTTTHKDFSLLRAQFNKK